MNDLAADALTATTVEPWSALAAGLVPELRDLVTAGIVVRGGAVAFAKDAPRCAGAPGSFPGLTDWECQVSSFHLDDVVPITVNFTADQEPVISEGDQLIMLLQGIGFGWQIARLARELDTPIPVSCIVSTNSTNGTFRFHRVRDGETWLRRDLDEYRLEKIVVLDS
jgi:hypothetical protein